MGDSPRNVNMAREVKAVWLVAVKKNKWQKAIAFATTSRSVDTDDLPLSVSVYTGGRYAVCPDAQSDTLLVASVKSTT